MLLCMYFAADVRLPSVAADLTLVLPGFQGMAFSPLLHLGGGELVKPRLVHCQIQRALRRGNVAADYLGATLYSSMCMHIEKCGKCSCKARSTCSRAANAVGWGSRDHTSEVQKSAGGPHYSMGMACISYPILPFRGLHLLPWRCFPGSAPSNTTNTKLVHEPKLSVK